MEFFQQTQRRGKNVKRQVDAFREFHVKSARCIAVVTFGGTTVPFEQNTVRFLDNFSTGNRGAASVEYFTQLGYAVIVLHRRGSAMPFARTAQQVLSQHVDTKLLRQLVVNDVSNDVVVMPDEISDQVYDGGQILRLKAAIREYQHCMDHNMLLELDFTSVQEYLFLMRDIATALKPMAEKALFYLAAAVSDYYIPDDQLVKHKIQSKPGAWTIQMEAVPKLLGCFKVECAPKAYFVSFKLETDSNILRKKAMSSIDKYGMHLVVANELHSRYKQVLLTTKDGEYLVLKSRDEEIERNIVQHVVEKHFEHIGTKAAAIDFQPYSWRRHHWYKLEAWWVDNHMQVAGLCMGAALSVMIAMVQKKIMH